MEQLERSYSAGGSMNGYNHAGKFFSSISILTYIDQVYTFWLSDFKSYVHTAKKCMFMFTKRQFFRSIFAQTDKRPEPCCEESGHCQALWRILPHVYNGLNSISIMWCSVWLNLSLNGLLDSRSASLGREIWAWRLFSEKFLLEGEIFFLDMTSS